MEQDELKESVLGYTNEEISIIDLFATILRYRRMIIIGTFVISLAIVLLMYGSIILPSEKSYLPNVFKPTATMLINSTDSSGGFTSALASSGFPGLAGIAGISAGSNTGSLAVVIAKSNTVVDAIVDKFDLINKYKIAKNLKYNSRRSILSKYTVAFDENTKILSISFEDIDPVFARDIVNYAVELIDRRFATIGGNKNIAKKEQLEIKLADVRSEMSLLEDKIQAFQRKYGVITVESIASEQVSIVAKVRSELIMKEMEIKTYGDISKVQDPAIARIKAERDNLLKLLDELEKGYSEYEKVLPTQRELPKLAIEFSHLQRDLQVQEKIFELLTQQYELIKLQIMGSDPTIQLLEPAEILEMKSGPQRSKYCVVAAVGGFFALVMSSFILDAIRKTKKDPIAMAKLRGEIN